MNRTYLDDCIIAAICVQNPLWISHNARAIIINNKILPVVIIQHI
jgi:hypothetical protein